MAIARDKGSSGGLPPARETVEADLCIIGAGAGGLSVAAAAAAFGRRTVLLEKHKMGGDCLNYGCVPSKALLAAAHRAQAMRTARPFGITPVEPSIDAQALRAHVQNVIAGIAPHDSVERFTALGVRVIAAAGRFASRNTVVAGDYLIKARRFVIATGSSPAVPAIPGLDQTRYLTNETIFDQAELPSHIVIVGGGPVGVEMAQAYRRLGSQVTLIVRSRLLRRDDSEMVSLLRRRLSLEGVRIREDADIRRVEPQGSGARLYLAALDGEEVVEASHLLVATGRQPNTSGLDLTAAAVAVTDKGIVVDRGLRTSNHKVFAVGDVAGGPQFTHVANHHAGVFIQRALFRLPARVADHAIPHVIYADPELAHVGLTEAEAAAAGHTVRVLRWPFHENDRARAERDAEGHVKIIVTPRGQILGATILGSGAGDLIQIWCLALSQRLNIRAMGSWIAPYPTRGEASRRAAWRFYADRPSSPFLRRLIGWFARLG